MTGAALAGNLPEGDSNGLAVFATALIAEPRRIRTAIVLLDTVKVTTRIDDPVRRIATARIRHIELLADADDEITADGLLRAALRRRIGTDELPGGLGLEQPVLPFDAEEEPDAPD